MALMFFLTNFGLRQMSFWLQVWTFVCTTFLCFSWLLLSIFVLFNNWHQRVNLQKLTPKERNAVCWSHCVCCHAMPKSKSKKIGQSTGPTVCAALCPPGCCHQLYFLAFRTDTSRKTNSKVTRQCTVVE